MNNFAISSADIGSAMERAGAALKAGGNTLNESLGLLVSGNLIQQDADVTAAALRTLSLRIRGAKTELENAGESTDGMVSSTAKLRDEIKSLTGVDIMINEDEFKSTAEIIKELGSVWENLTDVSQANVLELIAGKNRASTVAGLIENYQLIDEVMQTAENAEGSALQENERVLQSIEGRIQRLNNQIQEFWDTAIDSDVVKIVIDFLTEAIRLATELVDTLGSIPSLFGLIAGGLSIKNLVQGNSGGRAKKYAPFL